jgi:hypothetical protein
VTVTTSRLFVQLQVTAATGLPPIAGDTFTIELVGASFESSEGSSLDGLNDFEN